MRYRVLKFWNELGKNCRVFPTNRLKESLHLLAKNWRIHLPTRKKIYASRLSPPPNFYPTHNITIPCYSLIKT